MHATALPMNLTQIAVVGAFAAVLIGLRMWRMTRARRLRVEQLWVVPAIFAVIAAFSMVQTPPGLADAPWLIAITLIGAVVGWYRGKTMRITVDPQTHALNQSASPAALIILLAVFALRYAVRFGLAAEASAWGISVNLLADAPLLFIVGMFATTRVEMYFRALRLLREARAAKSAS